MKASELVEILERPITVLEKAQLIMDAFTAKAPSALNIKPDKPRKKREPRKPQPSGLLDMATHEATTTS